MMNTAVLAYHQIDSKPNPGITWITPAQFERQLSWLAENGYRTVSLSERSRLDDCKRSKAVVITFDDGYRRLMTHAFPLLSRHNFSATVFPVAGYVGRQNRWDVNFFGIRQKHLDWAELRELHSAGWEIGSHTLLHRYLPQLAYSDLKQDLKMSRDILEENLQVPIEHLSLPFGRGNETVFKGAARAGYRTVCVLGQSAVKKSFRFALQNPGIDGEIEVIPRRGIYLHDTLHSFKKRVRSYPNSDLEYRRQRIISSFSTGTVLVKAFGSKITRTKKA